jgi:protein gp37
MASNSAIEWCDDTLNLWWGCTKVSDGCKHCYAETLSNRYGRSNWGPKGTRQEVKSWRSNLNKIARLAAKEGRRRRVFVQSMSDTFEGPETCGGKQSANYLLMCKLRSELVEAIHEHPELDFLLLTKRPELAQDLWDEACSWAVMQNSGPHPWPANVWIGTSVEDQKTADERIPFLLEIPAKVRFLSCEPLLGPVDIQRYLWGACDSCDGAGFFIANEPDKLTCLDCDGLGVDLITELEGIHWVIAGGESGAKARPMHPEWARSLQTQCSHASVPFFFKQWGEWLPLAGRSDQQPDYSNAPHGPFPGRFGSWDGSEFRVGTARFAHASLRIGKKVAGRLLDGRTWDEFPEVRG